MLASAAKGAGSYGDNAVTGDYGDMIALGILDIDCACEIIEN